MYKGGENKPFTEAEKSRPRKVGKAKAMKGVDETNHANENFPGTQKNY